MTQTPTFGRRNAVEQPARLISQPPMRVKEETTPHWFDRNLLAHWGKYTGAAALIVIALAAVRNLNEGSVDAALSAVRPAATVTCGSTLAEFYELEVGMSYAEVRGIIGCEGEIRSQVSLGGTNSVMVGWEAQNTMFGNMHATFQNGELVSRAQFGLK